MILFVVLLGLSSFLAEATLEPNQREGSVASKAQIRFAIENRYDDTGPGAKDPERAHKMYNRLDDALVAYMNDPDTKLPDAEKIRAFRRLVGTDYALQHPNQLSADKERGTYKLMSIDPRKYNYEQPPSLQETRPSNNIRVQDLNEQWEPPYLKDTKNLLRFQELQNQNGRGALKAALEQNKLNKDPFYDALNRDSPLTHTLSQGTFFEHSSSREPLQVTKVLKQNVFQQPSSNRIMYKPENLNFNAMISRVPSQNVPSFFDLQRTVMKAEKHSLLAESPRDFESRRPAKEYSYSYGVNDPKSGDWKAAQETRHRDGAVSGYYALVEPDGKTRFVKYTADRDGFVAAVDRSKGHFLLK